MLCLFSKLKDRIIAHEYVYSDKGVDEPSRGCQRCVRGVVLCVLGCVLCAACYVCVLSAMTLYVVFFFKTKGPDNRAIKVWMSPLEAAKGVRGVVGCVLCVVCTVLCVFCMVYGLCVLYVCVCVVGCYVVSCVLYCVVRDIMYSRFYYVSSGTF